MGNKNGLNIEYLKGGIIEEPAFTVPRLKDL